MEKGCFWWESSPDIKPLGNHNYSGEIAVNKCDEKIVYWSLFNKVRGGWLILLIKQNYFPVDYKVKVSPESSFSKTYCVNGMFWLFNGNFHLFFLQKSLSLSVEIQKNEICALIQYRNVQ